ncbi:Cysteine-rich CWC [Dyadobacter koreensis]|uniref:Cysteine-rich CWC n=1 Tax=Dyadobacter koreensis TaxID=408657 RepID=A0A1H6R128_9BACT|nr:Cysteine-rich CWC [Dyadobacter koreensis]
MENHEAKCCPKCNSEFTCKTCDIGNCQCYTVTLSPETKNFLSKTSYHCLCKNCLVKTEKTLISASKYTFPTHSAMFIDGLHYYKENGNWVFLELYHILRGQCCKNGCRHCPYGFSKQHV